MIDAIFCNRIPSGCGTTSQNCDVVSKKLWKNVFCPLIFRGHIRTLRRLPTKLYVVWHCFEKIGSDCGESWLAKSRNYTRKLQWTGGSLLHRKRLQKSLSLGRWPRRYPTIYPVKMPFRSVGTAHLSVTWYDPRPVARRDCTPPGTIQHNYRVSIALCW